VSSSSLLGAVLMTAGAVFFIGGTVGVLRFRDLHSRLHAIAKADTTGLGLVAAGLALHAWSISTALKLGLVWLLALSASAVSSHLIARAGLARDDGGPEE
jgi:multicomponent Na+:H+ antiporter subunit G